MQTKTIYIAEDGKQFDSASECKDYENNKWFHILWIQNAYSHFDPDNSTEVFNFLQKHLVFTKKTVKMINEQA